MTDRQANVVVEEGVKLLMGASGITEQQAKTCMYYAVATFLDVPIMPVLTILGNSGTGKSSLLRQLASFVKNPKRAYAKTSASLREVLAACEGNCALIEEGDRVDEDLVLCRYSKETANIVARYESEGGWKNASINIFGSTIMHRRKPFADLALRNRAVFIKTRLNPGTYKFDGNKNYQEEMKSIAQRIIADSEGTSERVEDTWRPLIVVAKQLGDEEWVAYVSIQMQLDRDAFLVGQDYEPQPALEHTLEALLASHKAVILREVKDFLDRNFDLKLKIYQISEMIGDMPDYEVKWVNGIQEVGKHRKGGSQ